ncbi:putative thiazole-containing bacteriocin maturation protein [Paenibacillus cremeus]|uniref:Putative thiazole-containing bacteriocin maturation protein n=1 Tax=Paenibacillus cremeus TaxID=2163881 RepID=A0A559K6I8_9BACL|nr:putative thiazole-containing bacteriocin maturation protein [Paenibacillus cremeus]TVY07755.1 putative thiazole-containing bacteriocin maturation protein [Paenibacillus cremeus]
MATLKDTMRPKLNGDTFVVPDPKGEVFFRNNRGSFKMEGDAIDQWIEKLIPVFTGAHTLGELTDGLPEPFRTRVFDIAAVLHQNGFLRDVSGEPPHQLPAGIVERYASQIEFLDHHGGSGANRFEHYRQARVLAVGSGPFFVSLASALLESGLPCFDFLLTGEAPTNRDRLKALEAHAQVHDPRVYIKELGFSGAGAWHKAIQPYDSVLYVSQEGNLDELRAIEAACREANKRFIPSVVAHQTGVAGPLVQPDGEQAWDSAWRRIHETAVRKDPQLHSFSSTAGALLANGIVFELFKSVTGTPDPERKHSVFLLNLETLESNWYTFLPHPLVCGHAQVEEPFDAHTVLERSIGVPTAEQESLLPFFERLTSAETGIFHVWEEGELLQLPLAQCRVQTVNPRSMGPAKVLPDRICSGLTHEEARREAGLVGLEQYVALLARPLIQERKPSGARLGIGAGGTLAEGVCRGLQQCLDEKLVQRSSTSGRKTTITPIQLNPVADERCRFYLKSLTTLQGPPQLGLGEDVLGFPAVWVEAGGQWHVAVDLNLTLAMRRALQEALLCAQNQVGGAGLTEVAVRRVSPLHIDIPTCAVPHEEILKQALQILDRNGRQLNVVRLALEPFLSDQQNPALEVAGVLLREEVSP